MRMYDHYKARFYIDQMEDENKEIREENRRRAQQNLAPKPLKEIGQHLKDDASWSRTAFDPQSSSHKFRDRIVFSGQS